MTTGGPDVNRAGKDTLPPDVKITPLTEGNTAASVSGDADTGPRVTVSGPVAAGCSHMMLAQVVGYMAQCATCRRWIRVPGR